MFKQSSHSVINKNLLCHQDIFMLGLTSLHSHPKMNESIQLVRYILALQEIQEEYTSRKPYAA